MPAELDGNSQRAQTETPLGEKHMAFPVVPHDKQADCWDTPSCKEELQNTWLQRSLMIQGKILAEMIHKLTLDPSQMIGYQSNALLDAESSEPDFLKLQNVDMQRSFLVSPQTLNFQQPQMRSSVH